jgi:hypothetical protein
MPITPLLFSSQSATHNKANTNVIASDCRARSIVVIELLFLAEVGDTNSDRVLDDHDLPVANERLADENIDVVSG